MGSKLTSNIIRAPWTAEQVEALNRSQQSGFVHPYTCGSGKRTEANHLDKEGVLVATENGWRCLYCSYTQEWAHASSLEEIIPSLFRQRQVNRSGFYCAHYDYKILVIRRPKMGASFPKTQPQRW